MTVLYSDAHIVVAVKPAGLSSQKSPTGNDMLSALVAEGFGECFPVHRLDTATQGVMVYARTSAAAGKLGGQLASGGFQKEYYAVVHGAPDPAQGSMSDLLFHDKQKNKSFVVKKKRNGVKDALLDYETVSTGEINGGKVSLVRIKLHTGRTHQIRVQFASRGLPLCGDGKYGAKDSLPLMLCCFSLSFVHPATGKPMEFSVPCPFSV